ncbi:MAG: oligoendopeptidase F [Armatimonadota bacterium]
MKKTSVKLITVLLLIAFILAVPGFSAIEEAKERSQIQEEYKWDLESMYATDADWEKEFSECEKLLKEAEGYEGNLTDSAQRLLSGLKLTDKIYMLNDRIYSYAVMRSDEDAKNEAYQALQSRATSLRTKTNTSLSFIDPEILALPDKKLSNFINQEPGLKTYDFYFEKLRHLRAHILSADKEAIVASTGDMYEGIPNIYNLLFFADIKFPKVKDEEGKDIQLSYGTFLAGLESTDRNVRKRFYEAFYNTYGQYMNTFTSILAAKLQGDWFYANNAKYKTTLEYVLDKDNIPVNVYDNLIKVINENLDVVHRYYALRKKLSGLEDYNVYDHYYPIIKPPATSITYPEARKIIMEALKPLGKEYTAIIEKGFNDRWIDVYETKGKRAGAYSWGAYGTKPFILLNYSNNLSEVFTLAHELGHSVHTYWTNENQPYVYSNYPVFIAEVASTFNEHMMINYLLEHSKDRNEKLYLVMNYLHRTISTLYRQTMFAEFEKQIHTWTEEGKPLTKDLVDSYYLKLCRKYYGPDVQIDDINAYEWARVRHFYLYKYYVYQYSTCFAASTYFYDKIMTEGAPAREKYFTLLKSGGSDFPIELLKNAGLDMTKPESITPAIKLFEKLLGEAEKLVDQQ